MKTKLLLSFALSLVITLGIIAAPASLDNPKPEKIFNNSGGNDDLGGIEDLKVKDVEKTIGRKMKLKEKIAFGFAKKQFKKTTNNTPTPQGGGAKSQLVTLLLCIFLGGLGIHRFYLGYTWQGIVQILTIGGCGVWWLIDLIRIITGDLGPEDGSPYDPEL